MISKKIVDFGIKFSQNYISRGFATKLNVENMGEKKPIYFDYQATTPIDPRVLDAMLPFQLERFANPHSSTHEFGIQTGVAIEEARKNISNMIGAKPSEITFTSGATESNNFAIKGTAKEYKKQNKRHIITLPSEHKCVLQTCKDLMKEEGFRVTFMELEKDGRISTEKLRKIIKDNPDTFLVSTMMVNNEIGVIQPIKEIGKICEEMGVLFHTDAAQAFGKIPINVKEMKIDMMSITAHKIYGPKGIGGIFINKSSNNTKKRTLIKPIISGGGQEGGKRSGTLAPHLCIGFGEAAKIASKEMKRDAKHCKTMFDHFWGRISSELDGVYMNGSLTDRWFGNLNISFANVEGEALILALDEVVCVSSGSACTSETLEASHVLKALKVNEELAHTSIRFGLGRFSTMDEVDFVVDNVVKNVKHLRKIGLNFEALKAKGVKFDTDHDHH